MVDLTKRLKCAGPCGRVLPLDTEFLLWYETGDFPDPNLLYWGPDPYQSDVNCDDTPVWQCEECSYESAMDI